MSAPPNFEQALAAARAAAAAVAASRTSAPQIDDAEAAASAELKLADARASAASSATAASPATAAAKLKRPALPVDACRDDILGLVAANQVVVITGDTGSGKSTQLAQFLHQAGYAKGGAIAITQPRRVGAVSVSRRVAQEMGVKLGEEVGYSIRFEDCTSRSTVIKFMTDGCLLREAIEHKNLEPYNVIVLDEAHERSLQTDILFGLVRDIISRRPTLKFIITSATLDARQFSKFFFDCPTYHVPGRCHPVEIFYSPKVESKYYVEKAVEYAARIHSTLPLGDILVFLTGEEEIVRACKLLGAKVDSMCDEGASGARSGRPVNQRCAHTSVERIFNFLLENGKIYSLCLSLSVFLRDPLLPLSPSLLASIQASRCPTLSFSPSMPRSRRNSSRPCLPRRRPTAARCWFLPTFAKRR